MHKTKILLWDEMDVPRENDRLGQPAQHPNVETLSLDVLESNAPIDAPRTLCPCSRPRP